MFLPDTLAGEAQVPRANAPLGAVFLRRANRRKAGQRAPLYAKRKSPPSKAHFPDTAKCRSFMRQSMNPDGNVLSLRRLGGAQSLSGSICHKAPGSSAFPPSVASRIKASSNESHSAFLFNSGAVPSARRLPRTMIPILSESASASSR